MRRRRLLATAAAGSALGLGGCLGVLGGSGGDDGDGATASGTDGTTTGGGDPGSGTDVGTTDGGEAPDGVYVQPFLETMATAGTATAGEYAVAVLWTVPHVFWTVTGSDRSRVAKAADDNVHLMAVVWDRETGTVLPGAGVSVEITTGEALVSEEVIYPMLSQRMGFHYGGNFPLSGDGTYTAVVSVGGLGIRRTGEFAGRFAEPAEAGVEFEFTPERRADVRTSEIGSAGQPGAVRPMEMGDVPTARAPAPADLSGTVAGTARTDDADLVVAGVPADEAGRFADGSDYLLVSARTRYNGLVLPMMGLSATVERDGSTVFEGRLERTLDPGVGYHYGAPADLESGDRVTLSVGTPPQVARHEGYETAFLEMPDVTVTL